MTHQISYNVKLADPYFQKSSSMNLMIVDDSPLIVTKTRELLNEVMCISGIKSCGTYAEAVELLNMHKLQLALLDINLPDKSGIELLKYIKEFFPEVIVIMVTNQNGISYKNYSMQLGANHYIDKSKEFENLSGLVYSYCS
jgi:DNA-binding NarL/FixJ family response regulator